MSWVLLSVLVCCCWVMSLSVAPKVVVVVVSMVCLMGGLIAFISELKCYLFVLLYVGGLLITIIYVSSLTFKQSSSLVVYLVVMVLVLEETFVCGFSSSGASSVFSLFSLFLVYSVALIFMSCFLVSQLLLTEKALRSFEI